MATDEHRVNKAVVYSEPGTIQTKVVELPVEEPGPGEVLVRILYSGVCHTDYAFCTNGWSGLPPTQPGQVGGHEGIGQVVALGPGVIYPPLNTHVGIKYTASSCLTCERCLDGGETSCEQATISGYYYPGTFQHFVRSNAMCVTVIPEGLDLAMAAPLMCGGISVYTALRRSNSKFNDWVLISGAGGGLGHLAIQYAKALGCKVIALDSASKETFCKDLGADVFIDFASFASDAALVEKVKEASSGGVKTALVCSSSNRAYAQAMQMLGFRGTLAILGVPEGDPVSIGGAAPLAMVGNELSIFAVKSGSRKEGRECLEIAARGLVKTKYELRKMENLTQVFEDMEKGTISGRVVLDLR